MTPKTSNVWLLQSTTWHGCFVPGNLVLVVFLQYYWPCIVTKVKDGNCHNVVWTRKHRTAASEQLLMAYSWNKNSNEHFSTKNYLSCHQGNGLQGRQDGGQGRQVSWWCCIRLVSQGFSLNYLFPRKLPQLGQSIVSSILILRDGEYCTRGSNSFVFCMVTVLSEEPGRVFVSIHSQ